MDYLRHISLTLAMGTHSKLGASSPLMVLEDHMQDMVGEILRFVPIIVPDHAATLRDAVDMSVPGGTINVRRGEHIVGSTASDEEDFKNQSGATILEIDKCVSIYGESGTLLRGMLVLRSAWGNIANCTIQDAGDCCIKVVGAGQWVVEECFLLCGHACAVKAENHARVHVRRCRLGGEGRIGQAVSEYYDLPRRWIDTAGSVQEYGLRKHACYGVFVRDDAHVLTDGCEISYCSESALFVRDSGTAAMRGCSVVFSVIAFTSGLGYGRALEATGCKVSEVQRVWLDDDRPKNTILEQCTVQLCAREP